MILQLIVSGILLGGIYALLSVGLSLVLGVSKFVHFAHGDMVMVGMYMAFSVYMFLGLNPYFSWPIVLLAATVLGVIVFFFARFTIGKHAMNQILFTLGLSMILQNTVLLLYRADFRSVPSPFTTSFRVGNVFIGQGLLVTFIIAVVLTAVFMLFIKYSKMGRAMRAVGDDRNAALLVGIPVGRVDLITFCIGAVLACLAGALLMTIYPTTPSIGMGYNLIAWVTVVLGGLGYLQGTLVAAFLIAITETVSGFYLGADMRQVVYFIMFIIVVIAQPKGLFSGVSMRKVKRT